MCSHGDLVLHSICNISPQNTLLPCTNLWFFLFSSLLAPSKIFDPFLLLESIWGAFNLPVEVFVSARTMQRLAENFINQEQRGKGSRIWLRSCRSHAKTSSTVMQDLSIPLLTPCDLVQPHVSIGGLPCTWKASSVEWHGTFSQWDLGTYSRSSVTQHVSHVRTFT